LKKVLKLILIISGDIIVASPPFSIINLDTFLIKLFQVASAMVK